jgi:hypothetical protein
MTPDFALTLSFEGISLLRRVPNGWVLVGDVALDAADLRGALADLRSEADALSPNGGQVKLIIPNEQIKYLSLPDTGHTGDALQSDIRAALDGATPYAVGDLSFDWSHADGQIQVAAVAIETLDEAEAFAKSHHFDPVCFVANAPEGQFSGEVFFGPAASWTGAAPERDASAVEIVPADQVVEPIDTVEETAVEPEMAAEGVALASPADEVANKDINLGEDAPPRLTLGSAENTTDADDLDAAALAPGAANTEDGDKKDAGTERKPALSAPIADLEKPKFGTGPADPSAAPAFASIRASRASTSSDIPAAAPKIETPAPETTATPRFKLGGARKSTRDSDVTAPALQDEPVDPERKGFGFFSRRKSADPKPSSGTAKPVPPISAPVSKSDAPPAPTSVKHDPEPARAAVARIAAMRAGRDRDSSRPNEAPPEDEQTRMTVFGARAEPQVGGKPRFLGLMLTSALLIFLLAVAAWASVFLDEGLSRFFDRDDDTPSIARLPDVELLPLDGSVTNPTEEKTGELLAALDVVEDTSTGIDGLADVLPPPAALTPEEADARYAATGIWQRSPEAPAAPKQTTLDDLYVASIDNRVQQFDAVALPGAEALRNDQTYLSQPNPAAPGTQFTLDDRGLVVATPEGAVNPEGVRIFAGLPPVVPPVRPDAPEVTPDPSVEGEATVEVSALQAFRPRGRPDGLVENNERAQLAGRTLAELAALRPAARPETLKAEEEEAQPTATQFAVAQSAAPVTRPRNFAQIVERARTTRQTRQPEVTQVASVAPRAVQPRIPSTANVARQATVSNAINLRRINLIGVYGKPSNRRALVRLANGRYQKVQVGDRLDGGRVAAIGESELRYSKNGRNVVLDMPDG